MKFVDDVTTFVHKDFHQGGEEKFRNIMLRNAKNQHVNCAFLRKKHWSAERVANKLLTGIVDESKGAMEDSGWYLLTVRFIKKVQADENLSKD